MDTEIQLNYDTFKRMNEFYEKKFRRVLKTILRDTPRDIVIKILKELKIIKTYYNPATDKLELRERKE